MSKAYGMEKDEYNLLSLFKSNIIYSEHFTIGDIMAYCELCEEEVPQEKIRNITIKGKVKKICEGCITAIKGFA